ncbi:MAG: hypothetical protein V4623_09445, partial [Pseudomonadota bacterium]
MTAPVSQGYFNLIAIKESGAGEPQTSSNRYLTTNRFNYLGKYQMGTAALTASGLYSGTIYQANQIWDDTKWTPLARSLGVNSRADFLANGSAQEYAMRSYTDAQWAQLQRLHLDDFVGQTVNYVDITAEGLLAGAHLKGVG